MKKKNKVLATSVATIALCASLVAGGTYALFTSEQTVNIAVTSGTVDVRAYADELTLSYTSSLGNTLPESSATIVGNVVKIDKIVPGDTITFDLVIENHSDITVQYQTVLSLVDGVDLFAGLQIEVDDKVYDGMTAYSNWTELKPIDEADKVFDRIPVTITLPQGAGNEYQGKTAEISFIVKAVQGNADIEQPEADANTLYIYNVNDMKLFANSVNKGNNFSGKTVKLMSDVDLENNEWTPIGNSTNNFQGTFDGNGKTVENLYVEGGKGLGLFGYVFRGAYIHDVTIDGAYVSGEDYLGAVVGKGYAKSIENCVVKDAEIIATPYLTDKGIYDGGAKAGAVAGYISNGNICGNSAIDCSVSAYRDLGGIVGMMDGENYAVVAENNSVKNVTLTYLASPGAYDGNKVNQNMGDIVGRINNTTLANNTAENVLYGIADQTNFNNALASGGSNVNVTLGAGNYSLPGVSNKNVVISGTEDTVITVNTPGMNGSDVTFNGVTVMGSGDYTGVQHVNTVTYNDAKIVGAMWLYGEKVVFNNCTFELNAQYVWTYGAKEVEFNNCVFNTTGKAILIYNEGFVASTVTVKGCTFNATAGDKAGAIKNQNCAAIEIDNNANMAHKLITEGNTYNDTYFSGEWRIKNFVAGAPITVNGTQYEGIYVDGVKYYKDANSNVYAYDGEFILVNTATELQTLLNEGCTKIKLAKDIVGDVTIAQSAGVKITIEGNDKNFAGVILVDGKSKTYETAGLTIQNVNFKADSISADACISLGKDGDNNTRYTCNVTVSNCTFDVVGAVGVKSYTGGDKNLTIKGCTATARAHSLVQAKGIDGVLVENCKVYSKNGMNFNNSDNVTVDNCTAEVKGYAVRFGESSGGTGAAETYLIKNSTLKSANDDGDAVIILRGTADNATLTIENTTLTGDPEIANTATGATVNK